MNMDKFNKMFDHTLLKADASQSEIIKLCREASEYDFASVCVNGCYVSLAAKLLKATDVKVSCVAGFPLGAMTSSSKAFEIKDAIKNGADEIDVVINIGALKDGKYDYIRKELSILSNICKSNRIILKIILETCLLSDEKIKAACILSKEAGADFVKTSTGFSTAGAMQHHVKLMRETVGSNMKVKASGGIRTLSDAELMITAGADRLGCSASVSIMKEYKNKREKSPSFHALK